MRWVDAGKRWLGQVAFIGLVVAGVVGAAIPVLVVVSISVRLYQAWILTHEGVAAEGVVVAGDAGESPGGAYYCVESIAFKDQLGKPRTARRSCSTDPEIGGKVTVHYSPSDPSKTYVDGDANVSALVFWLVVVGLGLLWMSIKAALDRSPPPPRPSNTAPETVWDMGAAEELRRLGPPMLTPRAAPAACAEAVTKQALLSKDRPSR